MKYIQQDNHFDGLMQIYGISGTLAMEIQILH